MVKFFKNSISYFLLVSFMFTPMVLCSQDEPIQQKTEIGFSKLPAFGFGALGLFLAPCVFGSIGFALFDKSSSALERACAFWGGVGLAGFDMFIFNECKKCTFDSALTVDLEKVIYKGKVIEWESVKAIQIGEIRSYTVPPVHLKEITPNTIVLKTFKDAFFYIRCDDLEFDFEIVHWVLKHYFERSKSLCDIVVL